MFKVEEVENFAKINLDVIEVFKNQLSSYDFDSEDSSIEELEFEFNGINYALRSNGRDDWISDGKYENTTENYQLISYDNSEIKYPCSKNIIDYYNLIISQDVSRTGSYYTDWYYSYYKPDINVVETVTVAEVVIPEHDEVVYRAV